MRFLRDNFPPHQHKNRRQFYDRDDVKILASKRTWNMETTVNKTCNSFPFGFLHPHALTPCSFCFYRHFLPATVPAIQIHHQKCLSQNTNVASSIILSWGGPDVWKFIKVHWLTLPTPRWRWGKHFRLPLFWFVRWKVLVAYFFTLCFRRVSAWLILPVCAAPQGPHVPVWIVLPALLPHPISWHALKAGILPFFVVDAEIQTFLIKYGASTYTVWLGKRVFKFQPWLSLELQVLKLWVPVLLPGPFTMDATPSPPWNLFSQVANTEQFSRITCSVFTFSTVITAVLHDHIVDLRTQWVACFKIIEGYHHWGIPSIWVIQISQNVIDAKFGMLYMLLCNIMALNSKPVSQCHMARNIQ